jgi:hypothetical protein
VVRFSGRGWKIFRCYNGKIYGDIANKERYGDIAKGNRYGEKYMV